MQILSTWPNGNNRSYIFTIYKGSTTASGIIVNFELINTNTYNLIVSSNVYELSQADRLQNSSSSFLLVMNGPSVGNLYFNYIENATFPYPVSTPVPPGPPVGSSTHYSITPLTSTIPSTIIIRFLNSP
jgi:hypothetical protein